MTDNNTPEGWYPNTAPGAAPGTEMFWDGTRWQADQVRAAGPAITTTEPQPPREKKQRNIVGLIALMAGVVGFIFACIPGALVIGWILLPVAFILGLVSLFQKDKPKGMGITGLILSVVGTIVGVVVFISLGIAAVDNAIGRVGSDTIASDTVDEDEDEVAQEPVVAGPEDLVLGETAFGMDSNGWGWYAIQVTNPNEDYVFTSFASIEVEAYDAAGVLIDTDSSYGTILQGESWYTGKFVNVGSAVIDHIEVRGPTADAATSSPAAETGSFTMGAITTGAEYDRLTVNGTVTSNFSEDQNMVRIDLIARNPAGQIVGVDFTFTDRVPAGGTAAWNVSFWEVPLDSVVTAYPHL